MRYRAVCKNSIQLLSSGCFRSLNTGKKSAFELKKDENHVNWKPLKYCVYLQNPLTSLIQLHARETVSKRSPVTALLPRSTQLQTRLPPAKTSLLQMACKLKTTKIPHLLGILLISEFNYTPACMKLPPAKTLTPHEILLGRIHNSVFLKNLFYLATIVSLH